MYRRNVRLWEKLVIVESPNKVIKVEALLSDPKVISDWSFNKSKLRTISTGPERALAMATTGHFMSLKELSWGPPLPGGLPSGIGVSGIPTKGVLASFSLEWELIPGRRIQDIVSRYVEEKSDNLSEIIVATDPDREGELIAVHAQNLIRRMFPQLTIPFTRAYMHSITAEGIRRAMEERNDAFDYNLANAAEARHAMDRIFGFLGSSVVRYANPRMRSIGRVQTPALILISDREAKIKAFVDSHAVTYDIQAVCHFSSRQRQLFSQVVKVVPARREAPHDAPVEWKDKAEVKRRLEKWDLNAAHAFTVDTAAKPQETVTPAPQPFTMATLIAKGNRQLHFSSEMVSSCLQDLFQMGFITYPRTDSTRIDESVLPSIFAAIRKDYGKRLLQEPSGPSKTGSRRLAAAAKKDTDRNVEDAHEAIRPTNMETAADNLGAVSAPMKQIYDLIRRNTMAAFMIPMRSERLVVPVTCKMGNGDEVEFQLQGKHVVEPGWSTAFRGSKSATVAHGTESDQDLQAVEEGAVLVPSVSDEEFHAILDVVTQGREGMLGKAMRLESAQVVEHRPMPPLPFSEGGLIEHLKNNGVGRPSTYPMIVKTLLARNYITVTKGRCETTEVGRLLVDTSRATFPSIVDIGFTSAFEKELDRIAKPNDGDKGGRPLPPSVSEADYVLSSFVSNFLNYVTEATKAQRAAITTRSLTLQHEKSTASLTAVDFQANVAKESTRVMALVPDLVDNMKQYRTFTALQNSLSDYLRRYFPSPTSAAFSRSSSSAASLSTGEEGVTNRSSGSVGRYKKGMARRTFAKADKTPRRFQPKAKQRG